MNGSPAKSSGRMLLARRQRMIARHQHDERLVIHHPVVEVEARLGAQEGEVELAARERIGEIRRIVARHRDVDVRQFVAQQRASPRGSQVISCPVRKPSAKDAAWPAAPRAAPLRSPASTCGSAEPRVIEKRASRRRQFDAARAAAQQVGRRPRLRGRESAGSATAARCAAASRPPPSGCRLGDGNEVPQMSKFHCELPCLEVWRPAYKVFSGDASTSLDLPHSSGTSGDETHTRS